MRNLRGEITEAPPIYTFFRSRLDAVLWVLSMAVFLGYVVFPLLMWGGSDVVLYSMGLAMLGYMGWKVYTQYQDTKETHND